jgi:DNA polymerase elongation subunit (family B)
MIVVQNNTLRDPCQCQDYLIQNNIIPISFKHNRIYDVLGEVVVKEATEFYIVVEESEVELIQQLVNTFLTQ